MSEIHTVAEMPIVASAYDQGIIEAWRKFADATGVKVLPNGEFPQFFGSPLKGAANTFDQMVNQLSRNETGAFLNGGLVAISADNAMDIEAELTERVKAFAPNAELTDRIISGHGRVVLAFRAVTRDSYHASRVEYYRTMGEDYGTAHAFATADADAR